MVDTVIIMNEIPLIAAYGYGLSDRIHIAITKVVQRISLQRVSDSWLPFVKETNLLLIYSHLKESSLFSLSIGVIIILKYFSP